MHIDDYQHGKKVTLIGIIGNVIVIAIEFALGILGQSSALVADALHSLSDVGATVAVLFGLKYSSLPEDENHPYGHGKIESIIALFLGIILAVTGMYLLYGNISRIQSSSILAVVARGSRARSNACVTSAVRNRPVRPSTAA